MVEHTNVDIKHKRFSIAAWATEIDRVAGPYIQILGAHGEVEEQAEGRGEVEEETSQNNSTLTVNSISEIMPTLAMPPVSSTASSSSTTFISSAGPRRHTRRTSSSTAIPLSRPTQKQSALTRENTMMSCRPCKAKKTRCSGEEPSCSECLKRGESYKCDYSAHGATSTSSHPSTRARGEACLPCRKKKKRCDGVRPVCRTCRVAKQESHCEYDNDYIPALQEENQVYKDKIQELQAALAAAQALASGSEASGSSNEGNESFGMAAPTVDMPSRQDGDHAMHTFQPVDDTFDTSVLPSTSAVTLDTFSQSSTVPFTDQNREAMMSWSSGLEASSQPNSGTYNGPLPPVYFNHSTVTATSPNYDAFDMLVMPPSNGAATYNALPAQDLVPFTQLTYQDSTSNWNNNTDSYNGNYNVNYISQQEPSSDAHSLSLLPTSNFNPSLYAPITQTLPPSSFSYSATGLGSSLPAYSINNGFPLNLNLNFPIYVSSPTPILELGLSPPPEAFPSIPSSFSATPNLPETPSMASFPNTTYLPHPSQFNDFNNPPDAPHSPAALANARTYAFAFGGIIYGLRFTPPKTRALLAGDLSGAVLHPAAVRVTELWGLALLARIPTPPSTPTATGNSNPNINPNPHQSLLTEPARAFYAAAANAALSLPPTSRGAAVDSAQARILLALYHINQADMAGGAHWMRSACWLVRKAGLRLTLPESPEPDPLPGLDLHMDMGPSYSYAASASYTGTPGSGAGSSTGSASTPSSTSGSSSSSTYRHQSSSAYTSTPRRVLDIDADLCMAPTDKDHERDALCQIVVMDRTTRILLDSPSFVDETLNHSADVLVRYCEEHFQGLSITVIRLITFSLFLDTLQIQKQSDSAAFNNDVDTEINPDLADLSCITRARRLLLHLEEPILRLSTNPSARAAYVALQSLAILAHTVLVMAYRALARRGQANGGHEEARRKCVSAMCEVVGVSTTLQGDDFDAIDPFPMVCWNFILDVIVRERKGKGERWLEGAVAEGIDLHHMERMLKQQRDMYQQRIVRFNTTRAWVDKHAIEQ